MSRAAGSLPDIRAKTFQLEYDCCDDLEQITAAAFPSYFNASYEDNNFDSRSVNRGPEPDAEMVAEIADRTCAFFGLERRSAP